MTNTTHTDCHHPATKAARRVCRQARSLARLHAAKINAASIAAPGQLEKATELIELGGIRHVRGPVFRTVGSNGEATYLTHTDGHCTCPAGLRRHRAVAGTTRKGTKAAEVCYHVLAVRVKAATLSPARVA